MSLYEGKYKCFDGSSCGVGGHCKDCPFNEIGRLQALCEQQEKEINDAKKVVYDAVSSILSACGNSYSNSWCQDWLIRAKKLGAYNGEVIGKINDLQQALSQQNIETKKDE